MGRYPQAILDKAYSISQLEMINALVAVRTLLGGIKEEIVLLKCDNSASVCVLQNGRGHCPVLLACARQVWAITAPCKVELRVEHIPGKLNSLADALSRAHKCENLYNEVLNRANREKAMFIEVKEAAFKF